VRDCIPCVFWPHFIFMARYYRTKSTNSFIILAVFDQFSHANASIRSNRCSLLTICCCGTNSWRTKPRLSKKKTTNVAVILSSLGVVLSISTSFFYLHSANDDCCSHIEFIHPCLITSYWCKPPLSLWTCNRTHQVCPNRPIYGIVFEENSSLPGRVEHECVSFQNYQIK